MRKYQELTRQYAAWLLPLIDRYDCGQRIEGKAYPINTTHVLNNWREDGQGYPPRRLTRTHLEQHLTACRSRETAYEETFYYRCDRSSEVALWMIDVDAHEGQSDAGAVADFLVSNFFPHAHVEASTRGAGRHLYVLLRVGGNGFEKASQYAPEVAGALATIVEARGFSSNVCGVYGTSSHVDSIGRYTKRGKFAKLPRLPDGLVSLERLKSMPVYLGFGHVFDAFKVLNLDGSESPVGVCPTHIKPLPLSSSLPHDSITEPKAQSAPRPLKRAIDPHANAYATDNGPKRRAQLFRSLKIANPNLTEDQFVSAYTIATTENNRHDHEERIRDDFRKMEAKFFIKSAAPQTGFDPTRYLADCVTVPDEEFVWKRRERIDQQRLAKFVSVKIQDAFRDEGYFFAQASRDATVANFRALKEKGLVDWICTPNQYSKLLDIAVRHGLLEVFEDYVAPTRSKSGTKVFKGRARLVGPGRRLARLRDAWLPRYNAWRGRQESIAQVAVA